MRLLTITRKTLVEAARDRQLTLIFLLFPALLVWMYFLAFGQTTSMASYLTVLVDNRDTGPLGAGLMAAIRAAQYDGQPVFTVQDLSDRRPAEIALAEGKAALLLTVPADFSAAVRRQQAAPAQIALLGDPLNDTYMFARSFLSDLVRGYTDEVRGWAQPLPVAYEFLPNTGKISDFQFGAPGVLVYGVLFGVITSALMLVRETSSGTLQRIRLSGAGAFDLLGGISLANLVLALVQAPLAFGVALLSGFRSPGSLWLAAGILLVMSLGASGCGFLAASFSRTEGEATGVSTGFLAPLVFLSGAIYPMPAAPLVTIAGRTVSLYDVMPSTHAAEAMRRVLIYGDGPGPIAYSLVMLAVLSLLLLGVGSWLYQRRNLNGGL